MTALTTKSGVLQRTLRNLRAGWQSIAGDDYNASAASTRPDLPKDDADKLRRQMRDCLNNRGGEVSARAKAAALGQVYLALDATGRARFLDVLATDFDTDPEIVDKAIDRVRGAKDDATRQAAEAALRDALEAPRMRLLRQFNDLPEGVKFLVDMRAELLDLMRGEPTLKGLEQDLKHILASWFDVGFLQLRRIAWEAAPAALLEKLIVYEAVHAIEGWDDLKDRLDSDRRCFAYFHPRMPDEPLIFVEVALVNGIAGNIATLLDEAAPAQDPGSADTAIFYSISNTQKGLAGISFGNFLIKRVVATLSQEFPNLKTFSTLSPIPGFRKWLDSEIGAGAAGLILAAERKALKDAAGTGGKGALKTLLSAAHWWQDPAMSDALREPLTRLCVRYLIEAKGRGKRARDPVAHFHLSNGATIERLNWLGDTSEKGIQQSAGMMVNYLYDLDEIEDNHEAYTSEGRVAVSSAIKGFVKG